MKKGYKRLLIFEIIMFLVLILNSFVWNILKEYNMIIFLIISIIIFKMLVGIEKDRHRYTKDIIFNILIFLLISFLIYYIFGMIIGFYKIDNYFNLYGIKTFILPLILSIILKEYLRYPVPLLFLFLLILLMPFILENLILGIVFSCL